MPGGRCREAGCGFKRGSASPGADPQVRGGWGLAAGQGSVVPPGEKGLNQQSVWEVRMKTSLWFLPAVTFGGRKAPAGT